jgi:CheY-like chemotaxis protein
MNWEESRFLAIGQAQKAPTVLLVDDDANFVTSLKDALADEPYRLITASNGREALDLIEGMNIDLLVTDLRMPEVDGLSIVIELFNSNRFTPCIVMSAYSTPELEERMERLGVLDIIGKPIDIWALQLKIIHALGRARDGGVVRGLALPSFLQLLAIERKTCTVKVSDPSNSGLLFIRDGELLEASTRAKKGLEAAYEIFSWDGVEISIRNECRYRKRAITDKLETLLLDAFRVRDEMKAGRGETPRPEPAASTLEGAAPSPAITLQRFAAELDSIDGYAGSALIDGAGRVIANHSVRVGLDTKVLAEELHGWITAAHQSCVRAGLRGCRSISVGSGPEVVLIECGGDSASDHLHAIVVLDNPSSQALAHWILEKLLPRLG